MQRGCVRFILRAGGAAILGCLIGCATPYQQSGFTGGYGDTPIDSNTVLVTFKGNGYTPKEVVQMYLLYRCSEVTLRDGYDYFVVMGTNIDTKTGYTSAYGSGTAETQGASTRSVVPFHKYGTEATIKMFKGQKPADLADAYDARQTIQYLKPQLGISD